MPPASRRLTVHGDLRQTGGTMERITSRVAATVAGAGLGLLAAGCAGNAATATGTNPSPASAVSRALPGPFTITARYSAHSLALNHPHSFAIGADGNLYVTDLSQRVTVIYPAGKAVPRWAKPESAPADF